MLQQASMHHQLAPPSKVAIALLRTEAGVRLQPVHACVVCMRDHRGIVEGQCICVCRTLPAMIWCLAVVLPFVAWEDAAQTSSVS